MVAPCSSFAPVSGDLSDVMYHTIQFPLGIDLASAAQRKPVHAHRVHDVGEHRLDGTHAPAVEVPAPFGVKSLDHPLRGAYSVVPCALVGLGYLSDFGRGVSQAFLSNRTCPAFGLKPSEGLSGVSVAAFPVRAGGFHRLSGRTDEGACGVEVKLLGGKVFSGFRGALSVDGFALVLLKIGVPRSLNFRSGTYASMLLSRSFFTLSSV